eukprot:g13946.t1
MSWWLEVLSSALCTTQRLAQFAAPDGREAKQLSDSNRVVYVPGIFDLVHPGHVAVLSEAARQGDFLLVGLYSDETVRQHRGVAPILSLLERALAVLSLRWVDDVILGAPWSISPELLTSMNISAVVLGRAPGDPSTQDEERYRGARERGLLSEFESSFAISSAALKERLVSRSAELVQRNSKLLEKELNYISQKEYVPEA